MYGGRAVAGRLPSSDLVWVYAGLTLSPLTLDAGTTTEAITWDRCGARVAGAASGPFMEIVLCVRSDIIMSPRAASL